MFTTFKTSKYTVMIENLTHANVYPGEVLLYPDGFHNIRVVGEEAKTVVELMKAAGFVGVDDLLVNPRRIVVTEEGGAIARLIMSGYDKILIVPATFLSLLEFPPLAERAVALETVKPVEKPRQKKKAEE